jgi:hypothetical protein
MDSSCCRTTLGTPPTTNIEVVEVQYMAWPCPSWLRSSPRSCPKPCPPPSDQRGPQAAFVACRWPERASLLRLHGNRGSPPPPPHHTGFARRLLRRRRKEERLGGEKGEGWHGHSGAARCAAARGWEMGYARGVVSATSKCSIRLGSGICS